MQLTPQTLASAYRAIYRTEAEEADLVRFENHATLDAAIDEMIADATAALRVLVFYDVYLGRTPDAAGFDFWVGILRDNPDFTDADLAAAFAAASEFASVTAPMSVSEIVTALYRATLDRDPDAAGLAFWVGAVEADNGFGIEDLYEAFATSQEAMQVASSTGGQYLREIARDPDAEIDDLAAFDPAANSPDGVFFENTEFVTDGGDHTTFAQGATELEASDDLNIDAAGRFVARNAVVDIGDDYNTYSETLSRSGLSGAGTTVTLLDGKTGDSSNFRVGINEGGESAQAYVRIDDGATVVLPDRPDTTERLRVGYNEGAYNDGGAVVGGGKDIDGTLIVRGAGTRITLEAEDSELRVGSLGFMDAGITDTTEDRTAHGYLSIEDGAVVQIGQFGFVGDNPNSGPGGSADGTVVIQGEGSLLEMGGDPTVGQNGFLGITRGEGTSGALIIRDGGSLVLREGSNFGGSLHFSGLTATAGGDAYGLVTGAGSSIMAEDGIVHVGFNGGMSHFMVAEGARVDALFFNSGRAGEGHTIVSGEGTLLNLLGTDVEDSGFGAFLTVGRDVVGTFSVEDGADVVITGDGGTFPGFQVGRNDGGDGTITVTGAGSTITIDGADNLDDGFGSSGFIQIARNAGSKGALHVLDGGVVTNEATGTFIVGRNAGADGSVTVDGAGSVIDFGALARIAVDQNDDATLALDGFDDTGDAMLTVSNGGLFRGETLASSGIIDVTGGGMIDADLIVAGGGLLQSSGGVEAFAVDGGMTLMGALLGFDFADAGSDSFTFDTFSATGDVMLEDTLYIVAPSLAALADEMAELVTGASLTAADGFDVRFAAFDPGAVTDEDDPALATAIANSVALGFTTTATGLTVDFNDGIM